MAGHVTCPAIRLCVEGVAHGGVAEVVPRSGTHVTPWEPVVRWWGDPLPDDVVAQVRGTIEVGLERTFSQDPVFEELVQYVGEHVTVIAALAAMAHDVRERALPTFAGLLEEACDRLDTLMDDARPTGLTG